MTGGRLGSARVGVVTTLDVELYAAQEALGAHDWIGNSNYLVPEATNLDLVLCQASDRSHVPTVLRVHRLIEHYRPELVMVVGIAGGVRARGVALGDVVVPDYLHYGDFRKLSKSGDQRRYYAYDPPSVSIREQHGDRIRHTGTWRHRVRLEPPAPAQSDVRVGDLIAGDKLLGDPTHDEQKRLLDEFSSALAIDMESVGAARAVHEARLAPDYNPRFLVVRGISDHVTRARTVSLPIVGELEIPDPPGAAAGLMRLAPKRLRQTVGGLDRIRGAVIGLEDNSAERERWRPYAAHVAAAFAAEVAESYLGYPVRGTP